MEANPFDSIFNQQYEQEGDSAPTVSPPAAQSVEQPAPQATDNPFDAIFNQQYAEEPPQSSMLGAAARSAERGVVPALTGLPAAAAGAEVGAAIGSLASPVGAAVGGIVGGLGGMFLGAMGGEAAQDWALSKMSDEDKKRFGLDEQQRAVDEQQHPYASQLGGLVPYLVTARPWSPEAAKNATTALEKFLYDSKGQRALGGGLMGAWELGQEAYNGEVDPFKVAVATGFGVIFNHQNRVGQYLHNIGAKPTQYVMGRVPDEPPPPPGAGGFMSGGLFLPRNMPDPRNPTLRELDAAGVMGPGNTEYTWMGRERRPPLEELFAHKRLEEEYDTLYGPQPPTPDQITATARKMEPELFTARDALEEQRASIEGAIELYRSPTTEQYDDLRAQRGELEKELERTKGLSDQKGRNKQGARIRNLEAQISVLTGEIDSTWARMQGELEGKVDDNLAGLHSALADINAQIREQGPDMRRAHLRASEALGAGDMAMEHRFDEVPAYWREIAPELFPPLPGEAPAGVKPPTFDVEAERAKIIEAARAEHVAAGADPAHADNQAQVDAAKYITRAIRMGGVYGSPHALWVAEHATVERWDRISGPGRGDLFTGNPPPPGSPPGGGAPAAPSGPSAMQAAEAALAGSRSGNADFATTKAVDTGVVAGRLPEAPAKAAADAADGVSVMPAAEDAAAVWDGFIAARKESAEKSGAQKGYNAKTSKSGAKLRDKARQEWTPGNVVDVGFVKDLLVVAQNEDGSFTAIGKPDKNGQSQSYNAKPQVGVAKEGTVDFLEATKGLRQPAESVATVATVAEPIAPAVEGAVSVMPEAEVVAPTVPEAPATPIGLSVGDKLTLKGMGEKKSGVYEITSLTDASAVLTPVGGDPAASGIKLPRAVVEEYAASYLAESGEVTVEGDQVRLGKETLEPKLAAALKEKLAEQKDGPAGTKNVTEKAAPISRNETMPAHRVTTAAGTKIDVRPKVVEASELLASSDAGYDASLQPRNRDRAASQGQISQIAGKLEPDRLGMSSEADRGAPIVGADNMVESGNGRVMALREAYRQGGPAATRYRQWLQDQGYDVSGMKEPVLVRERVTEMTPEERQKFTVEANQSATLAMSASERAMADARSLSTNTLDLILNPDDLGAIKNRPFVQAFIKTLPQAEQGAMTTAEGGLSAEGLARVRNAVLAKAYGDAALMARIAEATSDEVKSISNALTAGAPYWAKMRADVEAGNVRADMDLTGDLMEAVAKTAELRGKGVKLADFLAQMDAFDRLKAPVEAWMKMFYNETGRRAASGQVIAERIKYYAEEARKVSAEEGLGFELPPVRPEDVQANAAQRGREQAATEGQKNLFEPGGAGVRESGAAGGEETGRQVSGEGGGRPGEAGDGSAEGGEGDGGVKPPDDTLYQSRKGQKNEELALGAYNKDFQKIWLKPEHNASTIIHEHGHEYLDHLIKDAAHEAAPQQIKDDLETVKGWLGWKSGQRRFTGDQQEKFARGWERYFFDGIAPSKELAVVFQRFSNWLRDVYRTVRGLTEPEAIPPEIRAVFDRLLAVDPYHVTVAGEGAVRRSPADIHTEEARTVTPERAGPMADRAKAEANRSAYDLSKEARNELTAAAGRAGVEPTTGIGAGPARTGGMAEDRGGPAAFDGGGASRAADGSVAVGRGADADAGGGGGRAREAAGGDGGTAGGGGDGGDAAFGRDDGRFVDKAGNIRLENLTTWEGIKEALREIAYGHNGFLAERRGRIPDALVFDYAEEFGLDGAEELVKNWMIGQAMNAEQVMALRILVRESAADLHAKAKAVADDGDWRAVRDYAVAKERHIMIQRTVSGVTAEAGRALRAFRDISGNTKTKSIEKLMREATGQTLYQLRDEAMLLSSLESEIAVNRNVRHMDAKTGERVLEYTTNNLISGPITHFIYTLANQELALWKAIVETPARAVISNALKAAGKDIPPEEMTSFGEAWQQILGMGQGFAPALKAAGQSMKAGLTTRLPRENMKNLPGIRPGQEVVEAPIVDMNYELKQVIPDLFTAMRGSMDAIAAYGKMLAMGKEGEPFFRFAQSPLYKIPDIKLRGATVPLGGVLNAPSRLVSSLHAFNRIQFYFMELNAEAFRAATAELQSGKIRAEDFNRRFAELKTTPDALMIDRAQSAATESTQMSPAGPLTQKLSKLVNHEFGGPGGPALFRLIDPFIHISSNVMSNALQKRTPLGYLSKSIRDDLHGKNGASAQTQAMSRMLMGTSLLATMAMMKAQGYITGAAPNDKAEAATWQLAGHKEYSVKINGTWYPYHRLGPLGLLMGVGADLYDVFDHLSKSASAYSKDDLKKMDQEASEAAGALITSLSHNVLEESFMRGPSELMKGIEGGGEGMSHWLRNFTSTMFTPFSVGMSQTARMADPVSRQARTMTDAIKNKIPGLSQTLLPRRDLWGEPIMAQTSIATKPAQADPVSVEVYRLGVAKAPVERKIFGVELTDEQYDNYQRIAGRMAKMQLEAMVNSPGWLRVPDPMKKIHVEKAIDAQREAARGLMMMKYREIPQQAFAAKRRRSTEIETNALQ